MTSEDALSAALDLLNTFRAWGGAIQGQSLALIGAIFGLLGGILFVHGASRELRAFRLALTALKDTVQEALGPNAPRYAVTGAEGPLARGRRWNTLCMRSGVFFLLLSLVLTVSAFFVRA